MMKLSIGISFLALATFGLAACSTATEDIASTEDAIKPESAKDDWELARFCSENIARQSAVKPQELAGGIIRWQCGDRPGVDGVEDRGQEYCEYFAVNDGKRVNALSQVNREQPLSCFFTSVYQDVDRTGATDRTMATALSKPENFDAPFSSELVRMKNSVNSRGAATTLIDDAQALSRSPDDRRLAQVAACALAGKKSDAECTNPKIAKAGDADFEAQRDMYACMSVRRLEHGGIDWRMSDPHIASVVVRATSECGCEYSALPDALPGFLQGTWSSADRLPPGCRRAKVDGADSQHLTICDIPAEEVADIELNLDVSDNLQKLCNDRFGKDIVLTAPLRAVEKPGSCKPTNAFCKAFTASE